MRITVGNSGTFIENTAAGIVTSAADTGKTSAGLRTALIYESRENINKARFKLN